MKDLSLASLKEFTATAQLGARTGTNQVKTSFGISAREFLGFAAYDFHAEYNHHTVNALSNTKRAIECQIDSLLVAFGLLERAKKGKWGFPAKTDTLRRLGIAAPEILERINQKRNFLEHEYRAPEPNEVQDALDVAKLFIEYTDKFLCHPWVTCEIQSDVADDFVLAELDHEQRRIVIRWSGVEKVIDAASEEYIDYLAWLIPFLGQ